MYSSREVKRCATRLLKKVAMLKYMKSFRKKEPDYTIKDIPLTPEDLSEGTYGVIKFLNLYKKALL
jgi:hypothetical protein